MNVTPSGTRDKHERRLTGLKVGAVAITVAGLGAFAGLAAAGTDDPAPTPWGGVTGASSTPSSSASDASRVADDGSFFDDQAQAGAVGGYADDAGEYGGGGYGYGGYGYGGGDRGLSQGSTGGS